VRRYVHLSKDYLRQAAEAVIAVAPSTGAVRPSAEPAVEIVATEQLRRNFEAAEAEVPEASSPRVEFVT
jgi:hypothetical protein